MLPYYYLLIPIGAAAGLLCSLAGYGLALYLLTRREKTLEQSSGERAAISAVMAAAGACVTVVVPFSAETVYLFLLMILSEAVTITDVHERIIPNDIVLAILVLTLAFGLPSLLGAKGFPEFRIGSSLLGLAVCFVTFSLPAAFSGKVGAGDVKLAAAAGFCLGIRYSLLCIVLMGLLVICYLFAQKRIPAAAALKSMIPMGPFLAASMLAVLIAVNLPAVAGYITV